ncbi:MAG: membrane or secreted protein [Pirellulaceae bacterium]
MRNLFLSSISPAQFAKSTQQAALLKSWAAVLMLLTSAGCQSGWIQPPGPMNYQQSTATIHDPFPQEDLGPSDLASRPPSYQQPVPQPVRNRFGRDTMPWLGVQGP